MIEQHTARCLAEQMSSEAIRDAWICRYPGYCRTCRAEGGTEYPGSLYEPPDFAPCPDCVAQGKCGRCGAGGFEQGERCATCGWEIGAYMPIASGCMCYADSLADYRDLFLFEGIE